MERDIQFELVPYKKVIIHELYFMTMSELKIMVKVHGQPYLINTPMNYCDGWLVLPEPFPINPKIVTERTQGILRWGGVNVLYLGKYKPVLEFEEIKIPLIDMKQNPIIKLFVEWLEKQYLEECEKQKESTKLEYSLALPN